MSDNGKQLDNWKDVLDYKARLLYSQIAQLQSELSKLGTSAEIIEQLCQPYYDLLESLYTEDYPLANAIESSDFVVRLKGKGIDKMEQQITKENIAEIEQTWGIRIWLGDTWDGSDGSWKKDGYGGLFNFGDWIVKNKSSYNGLTVEPDIDKRK